MSSRTACRTAAALTLFALSEVGVELGPHAFTTKQDALAFVLGKLRSLPFGPIHSDDELWLRPLLTSHLSAEKRALAEPGAVACFVKMKPERSKHCFGVKTHDDSEIDFSIYKCRLLTSSRPGSEHATLLAQVMRDEVSQQILGCRVKAFPTRDSTIICPVTGRRLRSEEGHVDHTFTTPDEGTLATTFAELIWLYRRHALAASGVALDALPLVCGDEGRGYFANSEDGAAWRRWYGEHAVLRVISWEAYLKNQAAGFLRIQNLERQERAEEAGAVTDQLDWLLLKDLKAQCLANGLPVSGTKQVLIARLRAWTPGTVASKGRPKTAAKLPSSNA